MERLDPSTTALLVVDLQKGILQIPLAPHSADDVVAKAGKVVERFHAIGAPVIFSTVSWSSDFRDALQPSVDRPIQGPAPGPDWADLADALGAAGTDIRITKRQWGAFYGTEFDLQLRRRGVRTLAIAGVATNLGVESTVRSAWEHGYEVVVIEDATSSLSADMHGFAVNAIFPMIARVRSASQILEMI